MQTRSATKKDTADGDDEGSVTWDAESIFDPPQHNFKSHGLDSTIAAAPSNNPLFTPLQTLDDEEAKQGEHDVLSFKSSLSKDMGECDDSFSEYLAMREHSLKGSPMSNIHIGHDLALGNIPFPSPLQELNDKDQGQIMNDALGMSFDFNENPAIMDMSTSPAGGRSGANFPRIKMSKSGSHCSLSTPPRCLPHLDCPPEIKKTTNSAAFALELSNEAREHMDSTASTPSCHYSPDRTIHHVVSKSPAKTPEKNSRHEQSFHFSITGHSHSTPERAQSQADNLADKSPEFSPPRGKLRSPEMRYRKDSSMPLKSDASGSPSYRAHSRRQDALPMKSGSNDLSVTPSPSHSQTHNIRQSVSDESNTPTVLHYPPPSTLHPYGYHNAEETPTSHGYPKRGEGNLPHPPSFGSPSWSNSLHLAPLPPFVAPNGAPPTSQWQQTHPGAAASQARPPAPGYGYPHYSPYHHPPPQFSSNRYPDLQASSSSRAEATHWRQKHHLLYQFQAKFGHCQVPPGYGIGTEYEGLFEWVNNQRHEHQRMLEGKSSTMTSTRARVLSEIGFIWAHPSNEYHPKVATGASQSTDSSNLKSQSSWSNWMSQLAEYRRKHGDVDVPLKYPPNPALGTFVNRQRTEYRKMLAGKPSSMVKEKVDDLNRLGFTWAVRESHTSWEERFEELKAYRRQNGNSNVPKIYSKNPSLGYWVNEQRFQYRRLQKKKSSYMTEEKIKALNSLDFKWSLRETNGSWENWLKELHAYKDQHGDVDVPLKYQPNLALGAFVNRQRTEYRKLQQGLQSSLNDKRINDLDAMGFKWAIRVSRTPWEKRLNELKKFKAEYGHTNVPSTYPKNQPLAYWVFKQRGQYRIYMKSCGSMDHDEKLVCHMTPERIRMLDEIGFEWSPPRRIK